MKNIAIIVTTPPTSHFTKTALEFVKDAAMQFNVTGVFFYQAGVLNGARNIDLPSDEVNLSIAWRNIAQDLNISLHLCSTAAERFGLTCFLENGQPSLQTIQQGFKPSGLGEMVALINSADRMIQL